MHHDNDASLGLLVFFFKQKTAYLMRISDWSSDVCSSDLWYGGDINRLTLKSEGEGVFGEGIEGAEIQILYSRAIGPYFNAQAGIRQDFGPDPDRTYATIGFEIGRAHV